MKTKTTLLAIALNLFGCFAIGQEIVKDIKIGGESSYPNNLTDINGVLYFSAFTDDEGYELWKSDGTSAGTVMVKDIASGTNSSGPTFLTNLNGILFFAAYTTNDENELWRSDGTAQGTFIVKKISSATGSYGGSKPFWLTNVNGTLFFAASNGTTDGASELWKSDGTTEGTLMVKNINPTSGSYPQNLMNINGTLFFTADDGKGRELWRSDGTSAGTFMIKDICNTTTRPWGSSNFFTQVNNTLYFVAIYKYAAPTYSELWKSDGTNEGTVFVKNIRISEGGGTTYMASCNGELFFNADDGVNGIELWKSNGTSVGTIMVKNINGISSGSFPRELTSYNGNVYFSANTTNEGNELWKSDGTTNGTVMVKDIFTGIGGGQPNSFLEFRGSLLFHASNGVDKTNTWKTDGTSAGTIPHPNLNLNYGLKNVTGAFENPAYAIVNNSTLFFSSINGGFGEELWKFSICSSTLASPSITGSSAVCSGTTLNLSASNVAGATSYKWTGPNNFTATTQSIAINTVTALNAGEYSVIAINDPTSCVSSYATKINVALSSTSTPTGLDLQTFVQGNTIAAIVVSGTSVKWYTSASDASARKNPLVPTTPLLNSKTYYATQTINGCESSTSLAVTVTITLGINDFESKAFSFYPNPVLDVLNLSYRHGLTRVKLFNVLGQRVYTKNLSANSAKIDMSNYKEGLYFMEVESNKSTKIIKVIKK